mmetsp:Transcript_779/g.1862  ORF Transcript_779/g.1862 Transcript_779/m.1862 type:complete len:216 (-) Transcript_779:1612-2259(-)
MVVRPPPASSRHVAFANPGRFAAMVCLSSCGGQPSGLPWTLKRKPPGACAPRGSSLSGRASGRLPVRQLNEASKTCSLRLVMCGGHREKAARLRSSLGNVPERALRDRSARSRLLYPTDSANASRVPLRALRETLRLARRCSAAMLPGSVPDSLLPPRCSTSRSLARHPGGIGPDSWLPERSSRVSAEPAASPAGMVPVAALLARSRTLSRRSSP